MTSTPTRASRALLALVFVVGLLATSVASADAADTPPRIDLRLLLVADTGDEPAIQSWVTTLTREGVPFDLVTLSTQPLPSLTAGPDHVLYQGVVLSNAYQPHLSDADRATLSSVEATFGLREVAAYAWPNPAVGLNYPSYSGNLRGTDWAVSGAGAATFSALAGPVPVLDDVWGYQATPLDETFTTLVGDSAGNALVGSHLRADGVEELVVTVDGNPYMTHAQILAHGLLTWVTQGVHLGYQRSYLSVHIDDVFLPDARWSIDGNCTPFDDCPPEVAPTPDIRMTAADVTRAVEWQRANGVQMVMAYNGAGTADAIAEFGSDPLTDAFVQSRNEFAWVNHTYEHTFLGCIQDFTTIPWQCATDANGQILWYAQNDIIDQIRKNIDFAKTYNLPIDPKELVTGEHSGLATLPQQPVDNPNLGTALEKTKVRVIASDASREPTTRRVGKAETTPRYPNNIFYNVATTEELLDEYNWLYLPPDLGGKCQNTATTTCRTSPASLAEVIAIETQIMQQHVLGNDPRPTFMHQSNLAEDGVAYPLLDSVLARYRSWFSAPLVQPTMTEATALLDDAARFDTALRAGQITAYRVGNQVFLDAPKGVLIPVTAPNGTLVGSSTFGSAYGGELSDWVKVGKSAVVLTLV